MPIPKHDYRLAMVGAGVGMVEFDRRTGQGAWCGVARAVHGVSARGDGRVLSRLERWIHPEDHGRWRAFVARFATLAPRAVREIAYRVAGRDGAVRWVVLRCATTGKARARLRGVCFEREEGPGFLAERGGEERRLQLAVEAGRLGVFERKIGSLESFWSPRMWEITGLAPRATGPSWPEVEAIIHPQDRAKVREAVQRASQAGIPDRIVLNYRIVRPDGAVRRIVTSSMYIPDPAGRAEANYGVASDVTEDYALREQAGIATRLDMLGRMAEGVAHQVAQPLQSIMNQAVIAQARARHLPPGEPLARMQLALEKIVKQTERARKVLERLLDLVPGVARGEAKLARLAEVSAAALEPLGAMIRGLGTEVVVEVPAAAGCAPSDLRIVLQHLFLKSLQAMQESVERRLALRAVVAGAEVRITISDTGMARHDADLPHIFDPFFSSAADVDGVAVGLLMARRAIEENGGRLEVLAFGAGPRFTIRLPVAAAG